MTTRRPRTSCNPCRLARIGCDAASRRPSRCSNCVRRGRICDAATQQTGSDSDYPARRPSESIISHGHERDMSSHLMEAMTPPDFNDFMPLTPSSLGVESAACRRLQATMLNDLLWNIYFSTFEIRYAIWLGDSCCPFLEMTPKPRASIAKLVIQMDAYEGAHEPGSLHYRPEAPHSASQGQHGSAEKDAMLNDALRHAVYAYAVRWLHIRSGYQGPEFAATKDCRQSEQEVRSYVWRRAKQAVMPALSRPSYRSILALLLITIAEMPPDVEDPGFGQLCNHALFGHLNLLRTPIKWRVDQALSLDSAFSTDSVPSKHGILRGMKPEYSSEHQHNRDVVFWLCVVSGCSRAVVQQLPSVILPARSGDHKVWQFIRQRTVIFDQSFKTLQGSQAPLPRDVAEVVLQHATACKTMYMGVINQLCDSLFYHGMTTAEDAAQAVLEESRRFHQVFDHLLSMCARDYTLLDAETQLNYLLLVTHYHLGTLILADVLDAIEVVPEQLKDPCLSRLYACQAITNTLSLVINCDRYSSGGDSPYGSKLLLDPAPDLMAEVFLRTCNAIFSMHGAGEILSHAAQTMLSIVFSGLHVLSQVSNKAGFVLSLFRDLSATRGLKVMYDHQPHYNHHQHHQHQQQYRAPTSSPCDSDPYRSAPPSMSSGVGGGGGGMVVPTEFNLDTLREFLQLMQIQASLDPSQLETMIKQHESKYMRGNGDGGLHTGDVLLHKES